MKSLNPACKLIGLVVPTGEAICASACPVGAERANLRGVRIVLIG